MGGGTRPLLSERDRRIPQHPAGGGTPPPNGNGNGNGDSNGSRGGDRPPPPRSNGDNGDDSGDGDGDDSPPPSDHGQPRHHRGQRNKWVYVVQGPPGPPGQPGQNGRDGHDGQAPQLPRGMINVPGVAPAPLDTTGLENSFENLGRTMVIGTVYPNIPLSSASLHGHPRSSLGATLGVRMSVTALWELLNRVQCMANRRLQA